MPTLTSLIAGGATATLTPSFPSLTFPNHYTIVTGQYPNSHGIVSNQFYDPVSQQVRPCDVVPTDGLFFFCCLPPSLAVCIRLHFVVLFLG